jgi:hypothetical protein
LEIIMAQRGRKSAASLSVVPRIDAAPDRPEPPPELSPEEAEVWREVVSAMSRDWFATAETHLLLRLYCFDAMIADRIAKALRTTDMDSDPDAFDRLAGMHARQTSTLISLATKMRLTHQSTSDPKKKKHGPSGPRPWELGA